MAYGSALVDNIQSSTANTPVVFKDGNGTEVGKLARAWVYFDGYTGGVTTINSSFNVTSVTKNATGLYTINFTTAVPNANYTANVQCAIAGAYGISFDGAAYTRTTSAYQFATGYVNSFVAGIGLADYTKISVVFFD